MTFWTVMLYLNKLGPKDTERLEDFWGFLSPEMQPHWNRFVERDTWLNWRELVKGGVFKAFVNVLVEWTRLDSQRAVKVSFDIIFMLVLVFLGLPAFFLLLLLIIPAFAVYKLE